MAETYYIWGRILGLFTMVGDVTPGAMDNYYIKPNIYYPRLFLQFHRQLLKKDEYNDRLRILLDMISVEDMETNKPVPLVGQDKIQLGMYQEKSFWKKPIGDRIAEGRKELSLTQEELAERAGLKGGKNTISRYENGQATPRKEAYIRLSQVLGYKYL